MNYPITDQQYKRFREMCKYYKSKWGIKIKIGFGRIVGKLAKVQIRAKGKKVDGAIIYLAKSWQGKMTDDKLDNIAKHELVHILIKELELHAKDRFITAEEYDRVQEKLVCKLTDLLA